MFLCVSVRQVVARQSEMLRASAVLSASVLLIGVCGCCLLDVGLAYEDDLVADYAVQAVDALEDAAIVRKDSPNSATAVVGAMVFAYGWNNDFIVAKQHPVREWPKVDTATTHWFVIEVLSGKVHGPLTEEEFVAVRHATRVPTNLAFTKFVGEK